MANASTYEGALYTESVSAVTATNSVVLGSMRHEGGRDYVYVYNGATEEIRPGRVVGLVSGATGYTVTPALPAASTVSCGIGFGVNVHATVASGRYFWACKRGFVQLETLPAASAVVAYSILVPAASGTVQYRNTVATGGLQTAIPIGFAVEDEGATTNTQSFTAYVNMPF